MDAYMRPWHRRWGYGKWWTTFVTCEVASSVEVVIERQLWRCGVPWWQWTLGRWVSHAVGKRVQSGGAWDPPHIGSVARAITWWGPVHWKELGWVEDDSNVAIGVIYGVASFWSLSKSISSQNMHNENQRTLDDHCLLTKVNTLN